VHAAWIRSLFSGVYNARYLLNRQRTGRAHVMARIPQHMVEASMSNVRQLGSAVIRHAYASQPGKMRRRLDAFTRITDLDQMIMRRTYAEECMRMVADYTGTPVQQLEKLCID